jgi:hypothetical protein
MQKQANNIGFPMFPFLASHEIPPCFLHLGSPLCRLIYAILKAAGDSSEPKTSAPVSGVEDQSDSGIDLTVEDQDDFEHQVISVAKEGTNKLEQFVQKQREAGDEDELVGMLEGAIKQGFAAGTPLAQRMNRKLDATEKAGYKACEGRVAKYEWRMKWANATYAHLVKTKIQVETWDVTDTSVGQYMSLTSIIKEEGDLRCCAAVLAGRRYVLACCRLGGHWVEWNEMTERYDYLYIRKGRREEFTKSWRLMKTTTSAMKELSPPVAELAVAGSVDQTPEKGLRPVPALAAVTAVGKPEPEAASSSGEAVPKAALKAVPKTAAAKAKPGAALNGAAPSTGAAKRPSLGQKTSSKKPKSDFDLKVLEAESTKTLYMLVSGRAFLLMNNIKSSSKWAWGRSDDVLLKMEELNQKVVKCLAQLGDIGVSYVSGCSVGDLVAKFTQQAVHESLIHLVTELTTVCESLKAHVDKVATMHTIMTQ